MTFPVDDEGNVRVDFVWGNMAMQPDQGRTYTESPANNNFNQPEDRQWSAPSYARTSDTLTTTVTENLTLGDQSYDNFYQYAATRSVTVPTIHDIATTGYNNFPEFLPNYAGDGDAGLEAVMPNVVGLTEGAAQAALVAAGFVYSGASSTYVGATVLNNGLITTQSPAAGSIVNVGQAAALYKYAAPAVPNLVGLTEEAATTALTNVHLVKGAVTTAGNDAGATNGNDGTIKTQSVAEGTTVDTGSVVTLVKYAYTVTANANVAGFSTNSFPGHDAAAGGEVYMFLTGRLNKPDVSATVLTSGNSNASLNRTWTVNTVEDDDSYNTGGTVCKLTALTGGSLDNPNINVTVGTWFQL
jgi:hypothetical protein